jgi:hypothetical protein
MHQHRAIMAGATTWGNCVDVLLDAGRITPRVPASHGGVARRCEVDALGPVLVFAVLAGLYMALDGGQKDGGSGVRGGAASGRPRPRRVSDEEIAEEMRRRRIERGAPGAPGTPRFDPGVEAAKPEIDRDFDIGSGFG